MESVQLQKRIIIEGYTQIDESARIHGVALIPRISRNNNLYTKKELARFHNVQVPLNWEHDPSKKIGSVTFQFNPETEQVFYDGTITDEASANLARNRTLYTSIEANPTSSQQVCNGLNDCFSMPFGLVPTALALTETPGVPETTVRVVEHYLKECHHDSELEAKYAPNQKHLQNEARIKDIVSHLHEIENLLPTKEVGNPGADNDCITDKISKLMDEDPSRDRDQAIAIAISTCSEKEAIMHLLNPKVAEHFCADCGELKKND